MNEKRPLSFNLFMLRLLSGIGGGIAGMLIAFIAFFASTVIIVPEEGATSLSFFVVIVMAFLATISANTITAASLTFMDSEKYSRRKTIITQVFLFNLILFVLTIPLYLIGLSMEITIGIVAVHFLLSAFVSSLIIEILAGYEYSLVSIYANSLGIFVSIGIALLLLNSSVPDQVIILGAMPGVWFILQLISGFVELVYDNYLRAYGVDALNIKTDLGGDSMMEKELEEGDEEEDDEESEEDDDDEV